MTVDGRIPALVLASLAACAHPPPKPPWVDRFPDADTVRGTVLEPGVEHHYLWLEEGPWAVHVLEVDEAVCDPVVAAVKAGPPLSARATTSELGRGALAAINADFFAIPGGTPVGAHVRAGRVLVGPGTRPAYALVDGGHRAGLVRLTGTLNSGADTVRLSQVNRIDGDAHHPVREGVAWLDEWFGPLSDTGTIRIRLLPAPAGQTLRTEPGAGRGVVVAGDPAAPASIALRAVGQAAAAWVGRREPGDTVEWRMSVSMADRSAREVVGGFPLLVAEGAGVYADQEGVRESFGEARHPRTAVGWDGRGGRFFWVVVDGRQAPYSDGMSLPELERLMLRLGATDAINLDGGGSSAFVLGGRVANRPSDAAGERPVGNALVLERCRAPAP